MKHHFRTLFAVLAISSLPITGAAYMVQPSISTGVSPLTEEYEVDTEAPLHFSDGDTLYKNPAPEAWQLMLPVAVKAWHGVKSKCPNGIVMKTMLPKDKNVGAKAMLGGCNMWISIKNINNYTAENRCILVAHEYGHIIRRDHVPGTLMELSGDIYKLLIPACRALGNTDYRTAEPTDPKLLPEPVKLMPSSVEVELYQPR